MRDFYKLIAAGAFMLCGAVASNAAAPGNFDISKLMYKGRHHSNVFESERMQQIQKANAVLEKGKSARFGNFLTDNGSDLGVDPSQKFPKSELHGDMDGPDGKLWFYSGSIEYEAVVHNEYWTEYLPVAFEFTVYNPYMKPVGNIKSRLTLKEDEARVRQISILPILTRNYFNTTDDYEVAVSVLVNPLPYGIRPYTHIYSLGAEKDADGYDVPVMTLDRMISDVCDASDANVENIIMTFVTEGNDSDVTEEDFADRYWDYQLGNFIKMESYAKANAAGELTKVFDKKMVYLQTQGNQQDDASLMTYVHNGKPCIVYPYYENVFYNPYTADSDMSQRLPNNLVIEIYEYDNPEEGFKLVQTTKIEMYKAEDEDVIASYFGVGSFGYTDDVIYGADGLASFIVTRRDYVASSDSERSSYFFYGSDGTLKNNLFTNAASHTRLSDLEGFDPMELFINYNESGEYVFNFMNMRTMETELSLPYGLPMEDSDDLDYMMANIDRTKVGDDFMYVVEMRTPDYDDIDDVNYMRVAWLKRNGEIDHFDRINMGNMVNYATLYISNATLHENYFHVSPEHEYMLLIKRAFSHDSSLTEEQLLVSQATSDTNPQGRQLLLLGSHEEYGNLVTIVPYNNPDRLSVTYGTTGDNADYTTVYYDLPLNKNEIGDSGVDQIPDFSENGFAFDGQTITAADAEIEVFNLHGVIIAKGHSSVSLADALPGIYLVRANGCSGKIALK